MSRWPKIESVRIAALIAAAWLGVGVAAAANELESARGNLEAARRAASRAADELRTLRAAGSLTQAELDDFRAYLTRLERVVMDNCERVLEIKASNNDPTPEPGCDQSRAAGPVFFPEERTEDERVAVLDAELGASMSEFDQLLLREMDELKRRQNSAPDEAGGAGGGDGEGASQAGGQEGRRQGDQQGDQERSGEASGEQGEGENTGAEQGPVAARGASERQAGAHGGGPASSSAERTAEPDEPPDTGDDDIVARQLREAAENETDPVLREKLWEEYRRYKSNQRAGDTAKSQQ